MGNFLVWSNEHRQWWRGNHRGYTEFIDEAGRYDRLAAEKIVADATIQGQLTVRRTDPVTGREYSQLSEVMVLAPEAISPDPSDALECQIPGCTPHLVAEPCPGSPEPIVTELLAIAPSADGGVAFALAPAGAVVDPVARAKAVELTEAVAANPPAMAASGLTLAADQSRGVLAGTTPVVSYFSFGWGQTDPGSGKKLIDHYVTVVAPTYDECREAMIASRFGRNWSMDYLAGRDKTTEAVSRWTEHEVIVAPGTDPEQAKAALLAASDVLRGRRD